MFGAKELFNDYLEEVNQQSPKTSNELKEGTTTTITTTTTIPPNKQPQNNQLIRKENNKKETQHVHFATEEENTRVQQPKTLVSLLSSFVGTPKVTLRDALDSKRETTATITETIQTLSNEIPITQTKKSTIKGRYIRAALDIPIPCIDGAMINSPMVDPFHPKYDSSGEEDDYYSAQQGIEDEEADPATGNRAMMRLREVNDENRKERRSKLRRKKKKRKRISGGIRPIIGETKFVSLLDTLPDEEDFIDIDHEPILIDPAEIYDPKQPYQINDLGEDFLVIIFSYLPFRDLIHAGAVCRFWYEVHKNNILWDMPLRSINHGTTSYITPKPLVRDYQRRMAKYEKSKTQRLADKLRRKKEEKYTTLVEERDKTTKKKLSPTTQYYRTYRRMQRDRKRMMRLEKKKEKKRAIRGHYNRLFTKPQVICEIFYSCFYTPLFFLTLFISTFLQWFISDEIVPPSDWWPLVMLSPLLLSSILYLVAMGCAITKEILRSFRLHQGYNTNLTLAYAGSLWFPLVFFSFLAKFYMLPPNTPYRVAFAPQWVISFIFVITSFIFHIKFTFLKWKTEQKVVWGVMTFINIAVSLMTAFYSTIQDDPTVRQVFEPSVYTSFVFLPVWIVMLGTLVSIPLYGCVRLPTYGWIRSAAVVSIGYAVIGPLIPFSILLALRLDSIIVLPYSVIFAPLMFWELFWLIVSLGYTIYSFRFYLSHSKDLDQVV